MSRPREGRIEVHVTTWSNEHPNIIKGYVNSLEWNDGMEQWSVLLEWSTGLEYWSAMPTNRRFDSISCGHCC